jgi:thioesterase domain-containing protein
MSNNQELVHVYFMPGMAANPSIFEYIKLPENIYKTHYLEWMIPFEDETLQNYAQRMCENIKQNNPVLIGVSFGGILVQEMAKQISVHKLIVISSITNKYQLPKRLQFAKATKAYKLMPTKLLSNLDLLEKYAYGDFFKKRMELYKKYLSVNDKQYLDWAIEQVVCWEQEETPKNITQIHGDNDGVFTNSITDQTIVVPGGTHIMILNKHKWFNEHLPKLILSN